MKIWSTTAAILLGLSGVAFAQTLTPSPVPVEVFRGSQTRSTTRSNQRNLRLTVTVDSPEHLKIKQGEQIKEGDTIG